MVKRKKVAIRENTLSSSNYFNDIKNHICLRIKTGLFKVIFTF